MSPVRSRSPAPSFTFSYCDVLTNLPTQQSRPCADRNVRATQFSPMDGDELCDPFEHRLGLIAMGGVAAIYQAEKFDRAAGLAGDGFGLSHGSVLIVETLN